MLIYMNEENRINVWKEGDFIIVKQNGKEVARTNAINMKSTIKALMKQYS